MEVLDIHLRRYNNLILLIFPQVIDNDKNTETDFNKMLDIFYLPIIYKCITDLEYYDYVFHWIAGDNITIVYYLESINWTNIQA